MTGSAVDIVLDGAGAQDLVTGGLSAGHGVGRQSFQVSRHGSDVLDRQVPGTVHNHLVHRAEYACAMAEAELEIVRDILGGPQGQTAASSGEIWRRPGRQLPLDPLHVGGTGHCEIRIGGAEEIARSMAFPTVPQRLRQVSAAVPLCRLRRLRLKAAIFQEQEFPDSQRPALVIGEIKIILRR